MKVYDKILKHANERAGYFCLLDPDEMQVEKTQDFARMCEENGADGLLVGGSIMVNNKFQENLKLIKESVDIPVMIFPGIFDFVSPYADALLLLSVVTSRNPQMLIGEQVRAAPLIKHYNLEAIGTAYMIIESGNSTSVQFMSGSLPLPRTKNDLAVAHALAGQYLGMKLIYMDAGSGAKFAATDEMVTAVRESVELPIILGGGIKTPEVAMQKAKAGADFIVTGNILEENPDPKLIREFADAIHSIKR